MKIFITGGSGVLGSKLVESLFRENEVSYSFLSHSYIIEGCIPYELDITKSKSTVDLILQIRPEITVHTSALTDVDFCETNRELANAINIEGTRNVVDACKKVNSKVIYISTSNVFDGMKKIFLEDDMPNPINYYGFTKLEGERIVANSNLPFLILRIDQPYSWVKKWQKKNFVLWVLEKLEASNVVEVFVDWYNNPTLINNFIEVTNKLLKKEKEGIYHVVGSDFINRYEWALRIANIFGKDKNRIRPIRSGRLRTLAAKRANANLSNSKTQKETGVTLLGVEDGLRLMLGDAQHLGG